MLFLRAADRCDKAFLVRLMIVSGVISGRICRAADVGDTMQEEYVAFKQRVATPDGPTWTVLDADYRVVQPIGRYLEHLRSTDHSPNTVESYAKGLELWWTFLDARGQSWEGWVSLTSALSSGSFGAALSACRPGAPGYSQLLCVW
ncbi:site-specific integrase [Nonomuraea bangladeshensis]|uniref:site-specific integrase n=1 Tax=Nonomuraea bangladeshensis TaxID=404385 RepID=UPI003C30BCC5